MADDEPPITRLNPKIIDAALTIEDQDDVPPEFLHSVLCQVGLPRSSVNGSSFERSNGRSSLLIEAGNVYQGKGKWKKVGVPYGVKPRLVLIHACSEAVRNKSPVIDLGNSIREFLDQMDLDTSGKGYALFRNQMEALCACHMTIGMSVGNRCLTVSAKPIDRFETWISNDKQEAMWPGVMELSPRFYETLTEHAMPLDPRAIGALKSSALALDIYTFLANRLCRIRKQEGVKLSWTNLRSQFGQEYAVSKDFKKAYKHALKRVLMVYPSAKVTDEIGGLRLHPSPAPIKKTKVINLKPAENKELQTELDL